MIHDPEQPRTRRQKQEPPPEPVAVDPAAATAALLARQRAGDGLALPRWWLARVRGDRRSLDEIAAEAGRSVADVRDAIDAALVAEGSSLAEFEGRTAPRVKLDRSATTTGPRLRVVR